QDGAELVAQFRDPAAHETLDAFRSRPHVLAVRREPMRLQAEDESFGSLVAPLRKGGRLERAVERSVHLDGRELAARVLQLLAVRQAGGIEVVAPRLESPAADAHMDARGHDGPS